MNGNQRIMVDTVCGMPYSAILQQGDYELYKKQVAKGRIDAPCNLCDQACPNVIHFGNPFYTQVSCEPRESKFVFEDNFGYEDDMNMLDLC
jgi:hypothetical protein